MDSGCGSSSVRWQSTIPLYSRNEQNRNDTAAPPTLTVGGLGAVLLASPEGRNLGRETPVPNNAPLEALGSVSCSDWCLELLKSMILPTDENSKTMWKMRYMLKNRVAFPVIKDSFC